MQLSNSISQAADNLSFYRPAQMNTQSISSISIFRCRFCQGHSCINIQSIQDSRSAFIFYRTSSLFYLSTMRAHLDTAAKQSASFDRVICCVRGCTFPPNISRHQGHGGGGGGAPLYLVCLTATRGTLWGSQFCISVEELAWMLDFLQQARSIKTFKCITVNY